MEHALETDPVENEIVSWVDVEGKRRKRENGSGSVKVLLENLRPEPAELTMLIGPHIY